MDKQYSIREVSAKFNLPASTLRYYEEVGILTDIPRNSSGKRIYLEKHIINYFNKQQYDYHNQHFADDRCAFFNGNPCACIIAADIQHCRRNRNLPIYRSCQNIHCQRSTVGRKVQKFCVSCCCPHIVFQNQAEGNQCKCACPRSE